MRTYVIAQKQSNSGSIHDIASSQFDRIIRFKDGCTYAVVNSSFYGGKGYTTHKTPQAAASCSVKNTYSHTIIDAAGNEYTAFYGQLYPKN